MFKRLVIFDGNHLAYRAFYKFANLKTLDGKKTSIVFGMPYIAESLIRKLAPDKVVIVFDGGRSDFRKSLLPTYKDRDKKLGFDVEDFHRQKDLGMEIFIALGIETIWKKGFEADDLITLVTKRYSKKGWEVIIVSADKDFNQLISPPNDGLFKGEVSIFNTNKGKQFGYTTLSKEVGYTAKQTVDYLSMIGDDSDKIPGYPGIGPKKALSILAKYGSLRNYYKSNDTFGKLDNKKLKEVCLLNKHLIDLNYFYRKFLRKMEIPIINSKKGLNIKELKKICGDNEINTFLKPQFLNTFNNTVINGQ